jgi:hypothetical protein
MLPMTWLINRPNGFRLRARKRILFFTNTNRESAVVDDGLKSLQQELMKRDEANSAAVDMSPCKKPKSPRKKNTADKTPDPVLFDSMVSGIFFYNKIR